MAFDILLKNKKGADQVVSGIETVTLNLDGGGTQTFAVGDRDWSEIGFLSEPPFIQVDVDEAKKVQTAYTPGKSYKNNKSLSIMPLVDTSAATTMKDMFYGCSALIAVAPLDTGNVTTMQNMFYQCTALTVAPMLNTENVTNMNMMFHACAALRSVPEYDTGKVTDMSVMFSGCSALETIPLLDTSACTDMTQMFRSCASLKSVPALDTGEATSFSWMFNYCPKLEDVPAFNAAKCTNFSSMFGACPMLTDESLNNILAMCISATSYTGTKTLDQLGLESDQKSKCATLSNWADFVAAGWSA